MIVCKKCGYSKSGLSSDKILMCLDCGEKWPIEKTYIFLTSGGTATDDGGNDVNNCQYLAIAKGTDVLTAFNNMLIDKGYAGNFNNCFAHELTSDNISGSFDLLENIPAECENRECDDCYLSDDVKQTIDCPYIIK